MQAEPAVSGTTFRDRSTRLVVFGVFSVIIGGAGILVGLLHVVLLILSRQSGTTLGLPSQPGPYIMGLLLYSALGSIFVCLGIGSLRKRRWAPPLMVIAGRIWILCGITLLVFLPGMLNGLLGGARSQFNAADDRIVLLLKLTVLGATTVLGVLVPALLVWAYRNPDVRATCRAHNPVESWTERCSPKVLGLSVGLAGSAVLLLPLAFQPVVPLFGLLVTGWPAAALIVVAAAICVYLARVTFDQRMSAWWMATAFIVALGVSTLLTLVRVDPAEIYRAMGYSERELGLLAGSAVLSRSVNGWLTVGLTIACVGYMVVIRRHFVPAER